MESVPKGLKKRGGQYVAEYLPHGTMISRHWEPEYVELVRQVEETKGFPICGGKKKHRTDHPDLPGVCKMPAGSGTDHPGEGRCKKHGGNIKSTLKDGRSSILRHRRISAKMQQFLETQELMDIRSAVALAYAALDEVLGEDEMIPPDRMQEIVQAASRIGTLIKQHHDVTEGQKLVIEVPQFMQWAEHMYVLAIKYIQLAGGNPRDFLTEAEAYFTYAVGSAIGDGVAALGAGGDL